MKANEMPERIYIFDYNDAMVIPLEGDTMYVREDAFIEKALKWIDATFHETSIDGFGGESVDVVMSDASVYKDDLLESFKNYMRG